MKKWPHELTILLLKQKQTYKASLFDSRRPQIDLNSSKPLFFRLCSRFRQSACNCHRCDNCDICKRSPIGHKSRLDTFDAVVKRLYYFLNHICIAHFPNSFRIVYDLGNSCTSLIYRSICCLVLTSKYIPLFFGKKNR